MKSPEEFNTRYWGPISKDSAVAEGFWSVFSSSLPSTQGLDFPLLPSSWKSLELKTCLLEVVQLNNLFRDEIWKGKMLYVELGSPCEEALQPRSCCICLPTKWHPLSLSSPVCLCLFVNRGKGGSAMGWALGVQSNWGLFPSLISFPPLLPDGISSQESVSQRGLVSHFCGVTGLLCLGRGELWWAVELESL